MLHVLQNAGLQKARLQLPNNATSSRLASVPHVPLVQQVLPVVEKGDTRTRARPSSLMGRSDNEDDDHDDGDDMKEQRGPGAIDLRMRVGGDLSQANAAASVAATFIHDGDDDDDYDGNGGPGGLSGG